MRVQAALLALSVALSTALPFRPRDGVSDTANDMNSIISGDESCAPVAVIFARGTFDSG